MACAAAGWLAMLSCFMVSTPSAQLLHSPHEAGASAAGAAECSLFVLGGKGRILRAGMRCTGPQPAIALASQHMNAFKENFTGVAIASSSCNGTSRNASSCLLTICSGRLVFRRSSVSWVRGIPLETVVCVVGDSMLEVHDSSFSQNRARALAVLDQAHVVLNASAVSNNSVVGSGGGIWIEGGAHVTITGRSRVHGNTASPEDILIDDDVGLMMQGLCNYLPCLGRGGGLVAKGLAVLTVDGNSSVSRNTAEISGGGLAVFEAASVIFTGGSTVHNNAPEGLWVEGNSTVTLTGASSVYNSRK